MQLNESMFHFLCVEDSLENSESMSLQIVARTSAA